MEDICAALSAALPPQCKCEATNNGAGAFLECTESIGIGPFNWDFGVRIEIEPCDCEAPYVSISFLEDGEWEELAKVESGGDPVRIALPGLSGGIPFLGEIGLYLDTSLTGDRKDLTVNVGLSVCHVEDGEEKW